MKKRLLDREQEPEDYSFPSEDFKASINQIKYNNEQRRLKTLKNLVTIKNKISEKENKYREVENKKFEELKTNKK